MKSVKSHLSISSRFHTKPLITKKSNYNCIDIQNETEDDLPFRRILNVLRKISVLTKNVAALC